MRTVVALRRVLWTSLFTLPALVSAQGPRWDVGLGVSQGGPTRYSAEHAVIGGGVTLGAYRFVSFGFEASAMLRMSGRVNVVCLDRPGWGCDSRELGHVVRAGLSARVGARNARGPYVLATAGGWASQWAEGGLFGAATSTVRPYGGVAELGVGTSLPVADRRTGVELRLAHFRAIDGSIGGLTVGAANAARLAITRRW